MAAPIVHIPYRTGQHLGASDLRALGRLPGVAGAKLAQGSIDRDTVDLLGDPPPDFAVLAGEDVSLSPCWHWARQAASSPQRTWPPVGSRNWPPLGRSTG
ncbi:dihydrodipicolinate synthase family protein [Streptomyces sp. NPDC053427]|uniref:dihydrodipicolinate synthase family protein n=1 Tax=Streptomyces sp. NPDC053427 TaxID=3365701 RepID=UPI0037D5ACFF